MQTNTIEYILTEDNKVFINPQHILDYQKLISTLTKKQDTKVVTTTLPTTIATLDFNLDSNLDSTLNFNLDLEKFKAKTRETKLKQVLDFIENISVLNKPNINEALTLATDIINELNVKDATVYATESYVGVKRLNDKNITLGVCFRLQHTDPKNYIEVYLSRKHAIALGIKIASKYKWECRAKGTITLDFITYDAVIRDQSYCMIPLKTKFMYLTFVRSYLNWYRATQIKA